jgi:hypothetical protein
MDMNETHGRDNVDARKTVASYIPLALLLALIGYLTYGFCRGGFFTGGF